jgi:hypothetical protein
VAAAGKFCCHSYTTSCLCGLPPCFSSYIQYLLFYDSLPNNLLLDISRPASAGHQHPAFVMNLLRRTACFLATPFAESPFSSAMQKA